MNDSIHILIVEDEALIAENLKLTLEDFGFVVTDTCYRYPEALAAIDRREADLVLLDINLGGASAAKSGMALAQHIRQQGDVPFIFLTAYSDKDTIQEASHLRPDNYLIKPVNPSGLFAAIQLAIEHHKTQQPPPPPGQVATPDFFFVKIGNRTHKLYWPDVFAIVSGKNYVTLKITKTPTIYPLRGSLAVVMSHLLPQSLRPAFIRINRSTCVNRNFIHSYNAEGVYCGGEFFENTQYTHRQLRELMGD